jgi:hypothetical protein
MGMNIEDRIAKLEKELKQLKIDLAEDDEISEAVWKPRIGEICEFSDDGVKWCVDRFLDKFDDDGERKYQYIGDWDVHRDCRPLNDPMVIQLIPHKPGDPNPTKENSFVLIKYRSGATDILSSEHSYWGTAENNHHDEIVAWVPIE